MIKFDYIIKKKINKKKHNSNFPQIPDHLQRILIIGDFGSGKRNALFNLIGCQPDIGEIYLYAGDPYEAKYQLLINKHDI